MDYDLNDSDLSSNEGSVTGQPLEQESPNNIPTENVALYKYTANGKEIEEPLDTILKRASQGYNYAQHMADLKRQQDQFAEQSRQVEEQASRWRQYDEFARSNPDWADHVRTTWENRNSFGQQNIADDANGFNLPPQIRAELDELRGFRDEFKSYQTAQRQQAEDLELNSQIETVKKEYPDIDLSYTDPETGKSLEYQVLEHAQATGLKNFRAAFRDFYFDKLVGKAVTKAKEETVSEFQKRQKAGFIADSNTQAPKLGNTPSNQRGSYFDLVLQGGKEIGII